MRLRTGGTITLFVLGILLTPLFSYAQPSAKVPRIGVLSPSSPLPGASPWFEAFAKGLRELGWVEGQNIAIESRWAEGKFERLPGLAAELVQLKVDVIVAVVTQASLAAKHATQTIPRA